MRKLLPTERNPFVIPLLIVAFCQMKLQLLRDASQYGTGAILTHMGDDRQEHPLVHI